MRLSHTDPEASAYEVWYAGIPPVVDYEVAIAAGSVFPEVGRRLLDCSPRPFRQVHACVLADEEAGLVEIVLLGPDTDADLYRTGIGYDAPIPPADELPYGFITGTLTGYVELRKRI